MGEKDCRSVIEDMHLSGGLPWTIPVTLSIDQPSAFGTSPSEEDPWTSLLNTKRKCTGLTLAMIESGICTVAVSHGAPPGPCTAPVHE